MSEVVYGLDLCCGGGGATRGYLNAARRAGVNLVMVGVDHRSMPRYVKSGGSTFICKDMFEILRDVNFISQFSFIHVSPPCQIFSQTRYLSGPSGKVDLLTPLRPWVDMYSSTAWIIENVPQAPLQNPIQLCGSNFAELVGNDERRQLRRHRKFEIRGFEVPALTCNHNGFRPLGVYGVPGKPVPRGGDIVATKEEGNKIMGIDWMLWGELREAIPPAYTEYIGQYLMKEIAS